jgi:hypothetical protein
MNIIKDDFSYYYIRKINKFIFYKKNINSNTFHKILEIQYANYIYMFFI